MAYKLAKLNNNKIIVGEDNGHKGENQFERCFVIGNDKGKVLLIEYKTFSAFAEFSRVFEIKNSTKKKPIIQDYINEYGDNCGQNWVH